MSGNCTILGYCCFLMIQILSRCMILWSIHQNYLYQMMNLERLSRKYLIDCLIQNKIDELLMDENLDQTLEFDLDSCFVRFEADEWSIKVSLKGDFSDFRIIERDKESESDIE